LEIDMSMSILIRLWAAFFSLVLSIGIVSAAETPDPELLFKAVRNQNTAEVKRLLDIGGSPNEKNEMGDYLLHDAVLEADLATVTLLLERSAHIDQQNANGFTPLATACDRLDFKSSSASGASAISIVRLLLERGANPNAASPAEKNSDPGAITPFLNAVANTNKSLEFSPCCSLQYPETVYRA
jgi:ankyrin repeat protein